MSSRKLHGTPEQLAAKRAIVLGSNDRKRRRWALPVAVLALTLGTAGYLAKDLWPRAQVKPAAGAMFGYVPQSGEVAHPVSDFEPNPLRFFQHKADGGTTVRYFVHVPKEGAALAALDACATCYPAGKGHRWVDGDLICLNCGKRFPVETLGKLEDECHPILLPAAVRDGQVSIPVPELNAGVKYFRKSQGS